MMSPSSASRVHLAKATVQMSKREGCNMLTKMRVLFGLNFRPLAVCSCALLLTAIWLLRAHAQPHHGVAVIIGNQNYTHEKVPGGDLRAS